MSIAADHDVHRVQICDNAALHEMSPTSLSDLKAYADDRGVAVDAGTRGVAPGLLLAYLDLATGFKSSLVRSIVTKEDEAGGRDKLIGQMRETMKAYEDAGVILALENHDRHTCREMTELIEAVDSPNLGICLDTVNSIGALEGVEQVLSQLGPLAFCLHVKDFVIERLPHQMGFQLTGAPAGTGALDLPDIFERMRVWGRAKSVILEQWPPFAGSIEETTALERDWGEISIDNLRRLVS